MQATMSVPVTYRPPFFGAVRSMRRFYGYGTNAQQAMGCDVEQPAASETAREPSAATSQPPLVVSLRQRWQFCQSTGTAAVWTAGNTALPVSPAW
jgi:hypothetical protein